MVWIDIQHTSVLLLFMTLLQWDNCVPFSVVLCMCCYSNILVSLEPRPPYETHRHLQSCDLATLHLMRNYGKHTLSLQCTLYVRLCMYMLYAGDHRSSRLVLLI